MKKNIYKTIIAAMFILPSCSDYLDVVPDKSMTLENLFIAREDAYNALARSYSYLPHEEAFSSSWLLGDEWVNGAYFNGDYSIYQGILIMRRLQNAGNPMLGTWSGTGLGNDLYEGINVCNLFIDRIDVVHDMKPEEKADWKAQVKFLKAYYHFLLLQQYGPIAIMDEATSPDTEPKDQFVLRSKIDDCFDYIIRTMNEAIPYLLQEKIGNDYGQVSQQAAAAIKAKVLVWRASPFYSGNEDYFDFYDHDKKPFFPQDNAATTKAKWKDALDAVEAAITLCEANGVELYTYEKRMWTDDLNDKRLNPKLQTLYDLRWVITDPWNKELIWGKSNISSSNLSAQSLLVADANIVLPASVLHYGVPGNSYAGITNSSQLSRNLLGATGKTLERFYTKHGLPLDEDSDIRFDRDRRHDLTRTPDTTITKEFLGFLQSDVETIQLYLDREPRFYANMGITGGYWRGHSNRIKTTFFSGEAGASVADPFRFLTGIGTQKIIHPDSRSGWHWAMLSLYPVPIIRLADLYLLKAEARNQWLDAPDGEVWEAINKVRDRAGIPTVQEAYTNFAKNPNKYKNKVDMLDIILNERGNEFAFEGHRFWDILRYRRAPQEFTSPVTGWDNTGSNAAGFFQTRLLQDRMFTLRDCLWPLPTDELNKNSKLIQNPGW
ncbi:RagB/SusD domain-containing protein [Candidatus Symbiothrix dinenymphae]|nr:RagB/SusD domain-containing protein [Candidatus Symbiothrix dinenymphae]